MCALNEVKGMNVYMKLKINKSTIIDYLVLFAYTYLPDYIIKGSIENIYLLYCAVIYIMIILYYLKKNHNKVSKIVSMFFIMNLFLNISTIIHGNFGMLFHGFKILLGMTSLCCYMELRIKDNPKAFLKNSMIYWGLLVIINILSFFAYYPTGWDNISNFYFLGNDNGSIFETFLYIFISLLYYTTYEKNIPKYFYFIILFIFYGYLFVDSGNGKVCLLLLIALTLFYNNKYFKKIFTVKRLFIVYILIFMLLVILRSDNQIVNNILGILGKNSTFTGRTNIWDLSFKYIRENLLLGNGYENGDIILRKIGQVKCHNMIIQFIYNGGLIGFGIFAYIMKITLAKIKQLPNSDSKNIIIFSLFIYFLISIFDYYYYKYNIVFFLLFIIYSNSLKKEVLTDD